MDLNQFDTVGASDEGAVMELRHPVTGIALVQDDGTAVSIRLAGMDSGRFRKQQRANTDRRLRGSRRGVTGTEMDAEGLELLVAVTLGWTGIEIDGERPEANAVNVRKVYTKFPWIREQVDNFVGDRANFLKNSPES
jgi:hypothetical protein